MILHQTGKCHLSSVSCRRFRQFDHGQSGSRAAGSPHFYFFFFKLFLSGQHLKAKMHTAGGAEAEPQKKRSRIFKMEGELDGKFAVLF